MLIKGSVDSAGVSAGTGAGADGVDLVFLLFFFLGFLPPVIAPIPPAMQQQHKPRRTIHSQIGNCEPEKPDAVEPELADPEESLAQDPWLKEPEE